MKGRCVCAWQIFMLCISQIHGSVSPAEKIIKFPAQTATAFWPAVGGSAGVHRMAGRRQPSSFPQPVTSWYDNGLRLERPLPAQSNAVTSWYDSGLRLERRLPVPREVVRSWYDAGVRLTPALSRVAKEEEGPSDLEVRAQILNAEVDEEAAKISTEATLAAGAVAAIATLGIDVASIDAAAHVDLALFAAGLIASQGDNPGPLGKTIRTVGNLVEKTVRVSNTFMAENELGLKSRAVLEVAVEAAVKAARNGQLEEKKKAAAEAEALAAQAKAKAEKAASAKRLKWPFSWSKRPR